MYCTLCKLYKITFRTVSQPAYFWQQEQVTATAFVIRESDLQKNPSSQQLKKRTVWHEKQPIKVKKS